MRWRFAEENNDLEINHRNESIKKIDEFWQAFESNLNMFEGPPSVELAEWVVAQLAKVNEEQLLWELSPKVNGEHRFVITPEYNYHLHPFIETMLQRAPKIPGFRFMAYREPVEPETVKSMVVTRASRWISDLQIIATVNDTNNSIDLMFVSDQFRGKDHVPDLTYVFLLIEVVAGQEILENWIGKVEWRSTKPSLFGRVLSLFGKSETVQPSENFFGVSEFKERVNELRRSILEKLPKQPLWELPAAMHEGSYALLELGGKESTRITCTTFMPQVILGSIPPPICFTSDRFSRFNETFCYLKIDESETRTDRRYEDRAQVEEAFDTALRAATVGCTTGGGWGPNFNFVDFAITDVDAAVPILQRVSSELNLSKSTWLRFMNYKYASEWIGMYADTPPPDLTEGW